MGLHSKHTYIVYIINKWVFSKLIKFTYGIFYVLTSTTKTLSSIRQ